MRGRGADAAHREPTGLFDVVMHGLHLLADEAERYRVLERSRPHPPGRLRARADTPKQQPRSGAFFAARRPEWEVTLQRKGFVFAHRLPASAS